MRKSANPLFVLALLPFLFAPEARASDITVTDGSVFHHVTGTSGYFTLLNKTQGFQASGFYDFGRLASEEGTPGETIDASIWLPDTSAWGRIIVNDGDRNYLRLDGYSDHYFISAQPVVLPSPDPSTSHDTATLVSFKVPFTLDAKLTAYPCNWHDFFCDPLYVKKANGQGIATMQVYILWSSHDNKFHYRATRVTYEFLSSPNVSTQSAGALTFSISEHGNLRDFESPANFTHFTNREGYALCSADSSPAFDDGETDAGWGAPVISQPGGANVLPLSITRATLDGKMELKQLFEWDSREREVVLTMTVKNLSGTTLSGVRLSRYFDGDIDARLNSTQVSLNVDFDQSDDRYAAISDSVWGWEEGAGLHHGLMLTALSFAYPHTATVEKFSDWAANGTGAQTARTCTPINQASPTAPGDYVGRLTYSFGAIPAGGSRSVKVQYKRM